MRKNKGTIVKTTLIDIIKVPLFFLIFYLMVLKIKICLKYFFGQKFSKAAIVRYAMLLHLKPKYGPHAFSTLVDPWLVCHSWSAHTGRKSFPMGLVLKTAEIVKQQIIHLK